MDEAQRTIVSIRVGKCDFEQLDAGRTEEILSDAERFVARLEHYLRQVGAIE